MLNKSPLWDVTVMNEGWLHLGKGGVAFWIESTELNCPQETWAGAWDGPETENG